VIPQTVFSSGADGFDEGDKLALLVPCTTLLRGMARSPVFKQSKCARVFPRSRNSAAVRIWPSQVARCRGSRPPTRRARSQRQGPEENPPLSQGRHPIRLAARPLPSWCRRRADPVRVGFRLRHPVGDVEVLYGAVGARRELRMRGDSSFYASSLLSG